RPAFPPLIPTPVRLLRIAIRIHWQADASLLLLPDRLLSPHRPPWLGRLTFLEHRSLPDSRASHPQRRWPQRHPTLAPDLAQGFTPRGARQMPDKRSA